MKNCAVIFTYPGDYQKASVLTKNMKDYVDDVFFCIESKHKDVPLPSWATPLIIDFNRCTQLHGSQAIIGIKDVFTKLIDIGYDNIIKLDSDTVVLRPELYITALELGSDFVYIKRGMVDKNNMHVRRANGCCYALNARAVKAINNCSAEKFDGIMFAHDRHEDMVFSAILTDDVNICVHEINKSKVWWSIQPYRGIDCIAAHFGYCDMQRIKEELEMIVPDRIKDFFNKENNDYAASVIEYCKNNNIHLKVYKNLYDKDGKPLNSEVSNSETKQGEH